MLEQQRAPIAPVGGYPPMTTLQGAVPGWPPGDRLTPVSSPDAARLTLRAESETSVLDPVGLRRLWVRDLYFILALAFLVGLLVGSVQYVRNDYRSPSWWLGLMFVGLVLNVSPILGCFLWRAVPGPGVVPRLGPARWRWYRRVRQDGGSMPPVASWPPGAEAYAVLSGAASVQSVAPSWLCERVGLSPAVGAEWVRVLTSQGWLRGGGHFLGLERLPELPVEVTIDGRERLDAERSRLATLAAR